MMPSGSNLSSNVVVVLCPDNAGRAAAPAPARVTWRAVRGSCAVAAERVCPLLCFQSVKRVEATFARGLHFGEQRCCYQYEFEKMVILAYAPNVFATLCKKNSVFVAILHQIFCSKFDM
jgi:hypothetical protein